MRADEQISSSVFLSCALWCYKLISSTPYKLAHFLTRKLTNLFP